LSQRLPFRFLDCRVKPGNDSFEELLAKNSQSVMPGLDPGNHVQSRLNVL
jgi:hypothetical protein